MQWVCRKGCWNDKKGLCKGCAPDLGVEMAAAQAQRSVEEIHAHARMAEEDKKLSEENGSHRKREGLSQKGYPISLALLFVRLTPEPDPLGQKLRHRGVPEKQRLVS